MGRILLCIGKRAEKPYFFDKTCQNLYAIEELCFVLGENAYLVDEEIMDRQLVEWIEKECELPSLAGNLYTLINRKASTAAFVGAILEYTGYYSKDEIWKIESILKNGRNLNLYERKKAKADSLVKHRRFVPAITEYDSLIKEIPKQEKELLAKVHHNKAVAQTGLFAYEFASTEFQLAYELSGEEEDYLDYLTAKRLALKEQEYIRFVAEHSEGYEASLKVERRMNQIAQQWERSEERERMDVLLDDKKNGNKNLYYKEVERQISGLKQEYRECVMS